MTKSTILNDSFYNTGHNKELYTNYVTSCINSGSIESIMSFEEFLLGIYKQQIDEYYDWLYNTYVVNKQQYYEATQVTCY
jgi:hypothetical protein